MAFSGSDELALIDLGASGPDAVASPRRPARSWRFVLAAFVGVVAVAALTGSARVRTPLGAPIWTVALGDAGFQLIDGLVVVPKPDAVTAYDVTTGAPRWTLQTSWSFVQAVIPGVLAIAGPDSTQLVDTATGAVRATVPGQERMVVGSGADAVLVMDVDVGQDGCPPDTACSDVVGVAVSTGQPLWRLAYQPNRILAFNEDPSVKTVVATSDAGRAELRDLATGRVLTASDLAGWTEPAPGHSVSLIGETLYAIHQAPISSQGLRPLTVPSVVSAYPVGPGGHRWSVTLDLAPSIVDNGGLDIGNCGDLLCIQAADNQAWLDPVTGAERAAPSQPPDNVLDIGQDLELTLVVDGGVVVTLLRRTSTGVEVARIIGRVVPIHGDLGRPFVAIVHPNGVADLARVNAAGFDILGPLGRVSGCAATGGRLICAMPFSEASPIEVRVDVWALPG